MLNPFTVGVAQTVRTTNVLRGLRTIIYLFILTATISTVMLYARKVKKDKSKSIVYELEKEEGHIIQEITYQHFSKRQALAYLL